MAKPEFTCAVKVQYLSEHSNPPDGPFGFAYTVTIANTGDCTAQLVARRWLVTDAHGQTQEVRGLAVVGHQPVLQPGQRFEYSSWTPLATPHGTMRGTFYCMTDDARPFEADVPAFALVYPGLLQ